MNVAIFGGTFDPVHRGHLAVARAAQRACRLDRIYFVPADIPPHKRRQPITAYEHRYAMLAIALRGESTFIPSLMESSSQASGVRLRAKRPNYSIDTVRRFKRMLSKGDRLFFIVGIDMFETIDTWHKPKELMREVEFVVVSRPGYKISPPKTPFAQRRLRKTKEIHWVTNVAEDVSSTALRRGLASGSAVRGLVDEAVVDYIRKQHLYTSTE